jgi:hypothetical protein
MVGHSVFSNVGSCLYKARNTYLSVCPGPRELFITKLRRPIGIIIRAIKYSKLVAKVARKERDIAEITGEIIGHEINRGIRKNIKAKVRRLIDMSKVRTNNTHLSNGISWFTKSKRVPLLIMYHEADRAGKHIDIHIGKVSFIMRVSGKPVESRIKFNNKGILTESSKKALMDHVKGEIKNNSRVPQNIDHDKEEAKITWTARERKTAGYGAGLTRQPIVQSEAQVISVNNSATIYAPDIDHNRMIFTHTLYSSIGKKAPIAIIGTRRRDTPVFLGKPKFKYIKGKDIEKYKSKVDLSTNTLKDDGASCHIVIDKSGTRIYSPRSSIVTGTKKEYTGLFPSVANVKSKSPIHLMGEFMVYNGNTPLESATVGGFLNSHSLIPKNLRPEIHIYRVDKYKGIDGRDIDFWENRRYQETVARKLGRNVSVVKLMPLEDTKRGKREGAVAAPKGGNLWDAYKIKWRDDTYDWRIDKVTFKLGPTSTKESPKVAGKLYCTSTSSGNVYELGPGQFGTREECLDVMKHPSKYIGRVVEVECLRGHEGRSAKKISIRSDK